MSSSDNMSEVDRRIDEIIQCGIKDSRKTPVYRVVLTGGPCGGKTTASTVISERFTALGWRVWRVPEAANILLSGGMSFYNMTPEAQFNFQKTLLLLMLQLEDSFISLAKASNEKSIVLMDRGTMDCRSYMPEEDWLRMLDELGLNTLQLRDERYDCVIHLVTAADGATKFYTCEGHASRTEPPEVARAIDGRIKQNWVGHPYFTVIDNRSDFQSKMSRVVTSICKFLGLKQAGVYKRKYLIKNFDASKIPVKTIEFDVEHNFLIRNDNTQARLRKRGSAGHYSYSVTIRYPELHGQRLELKRALTRREYADLYLQRDPTREAVVKRRIGFLYENQYFELDVFQKPHAGLVLLEFYTEDTESNKVPAFLEVEMEVTKNPEYSMYNLALRQNADDQVARSVPASPALTATNFMVRPTSKSVCSVPNSPFVASSATASATSSMKDLQL